tara:strand:+ start:28 stop:873 length:846 start_codon:yes stop_codon:yes gene_type:complete
MAHAFGKNSFGTPPKGPSGKFGVDPWWCELKVEFELTIMGSQDGVTASMSLKAKEGCQPPGNSPGKDKVEISSYTQGLGFSPTIRSNKPPKNKGLCDAFSDIDGINHIFQADNYISPDQLSNLLKDLSSETENAKEGVPSLGEQMKMLCAESKKKRGVGNPAYFDTEYSIKVTCYKLVDQECKGSGGCGGDITVVLDADINQDFDGIASFLPVIDPCEFSKLLDCWKKNPKADTTTTPGQQQDIALGLATLNPPTPQVDVDKAAKAVIKILLDQCLGGKKK